MDEIVRWLMSSPIGVVVLGAVGSLLAIALLRLAKAIINLASKGKGKWRDREYRLGYEAGAVTGYLTVKKDLIILTSYLTWRAVRFVGLVGLCILTAILFLAALPSASYPALTVTTLLLSIGFFLLARLAYEEYRHLYHCVEPLFRPMMDEIASIRDKSKGEGSS